MPTKPAIASVTIWGILISAFCTAFPKAATMLHLTDPNTLAAIQTILGTFGTLIGLCVALYGRYHTSTPIAGLVKTPASTSGGLPPAAANLLLGFVFVPMTALFIVAALSGCASVSTTAATPAGSAAIVSTLGQVTAAVNAHPAATDQGRQDAEIAFVVSAEGLEALHGSGMLGGANLSVARSDLETAYKVLVAARLALTVAGAVPSTALIADEAQSDSVYTRVDAELVAS